MEALLAAELPDGAGWQFEPKWDGFRCLARRDGAEVTLTSKSGKPLARYFPDVVAMLAGFAEDITAAVPNGAEVEVNPLEALLKVI